MATKKVVNMFISGLKLVFFKFDLLLRPDSSGHLRNCRFWNFHVSISRQTWSLLLSSNQFLLGIFYLLAIFALLFAVYAKELLRIFISCLKQLNADCIPSGSSYQCGEASKKVAWHLEFLWKLHWDICISCGQPTDFQCYNIHSKSSGESNVAYL